MNSTPAESRFAVRHTPPDEQDPRFDRSAPTQVHFLRFAVRHTPPDQQDPVSTVGGPTEVCFLCFAVRQTPPNEQDPVSNVAAGRTQGCLLHCAVRQASFPSAIPSKPLDEHDDAFCSDPAGCLPMNTTTTLFLRSDPAMYTTLAVRMRE